MQSNCYVLIDGHFIAARLTGRYELRSEGLAKFTVELMQFPGESIDVPAASIFMPLDKTNGVKW